MVIPIGEEEPDDIIFTVDDGDVLDPVLPPTVAADAPLAPADDSNAAAVDPVGNDAVGDVVAGVELEAQPAEPDLAEYGLAGSPEYTELQYQEIGRPIRHFGYEGILSPAEQHVSDDPAVAWAGMTVFSQAFLEREVMENVCLSGPMSVDTCLPESIPCACCTCKDTCFQV